MQYWMYSIFVFKLVNVSSLIGDFSCTWWVRKRLILTSKMSFSFSKWRRVKIGDRWGEEEVQCLACRNGSGVWPWTWALLPSLPEATRSAVAWPWEAVLLFLDCNWLRARIFATANLRSSRMRFQSANICSFLLFLRQKRLYSIVNFRVTFRQGVHRSQLSKVLHR